MTLGVRRLPFALDPLIAEAKLRMRRRRFLLTVALLALVAVAVGAGFLLRSGGAGELRGTATHTGVAHIPGMTTVIATSGAGGGVCAMKGGTFPPWCSAVKVRRNWFQQWILTAAIKRYGRRVSSEGVKIPLVEVPPLFELSHPGPAEVTDEVLALASAKQAAFALQHMQAFQAYAIGHYARRPDAAINGGIAASISASVPSNPRYFVPPVISFTWASGRDLVEVDVLGANLTVPEAQQIALKVGPS